MNVDFTDRSSSLSLAYALSEATETTRSGNVETLLDRSVGMLSGTTYYRPYYVAAKELGMSPREQRLTEGKGAKFSGMTRPIETMLQMQQKIDGELGLEIPGEFQITEEDSLLPSDKCGCDNSGGIFPYVFSGSVDIAGVH